MTLPATGAISLNLVKNELGRLTGDRMELGELMTRMFAYDVARWDWGTPMSFDELRDRGAVGFRAFMGSLDGGAAVGCRTGDGINTIPAWSDYGTPGSLTHASRHTFEISSGRYDAWGFGPTEQTVFRTQSVGYGYPEPRFLVVFNDDFQYIGHMDGTWNGSRGTNPRAPDNFGSYPAPYAFMHLGWSFTNDLYGYSPSIVDLRAYAGSWLRFALYREPPP